MSNNQKSREMSNESKVFMHRSRGRFRCDHCGDVADLQQSWLKKDEGLICNDCETDLYRTYCPRCETYVETDAPQCGLDLRAEDCAVQNGTDLDVLQEWLDEGGASEDFMNPEND